ncbi:MAG: DegT/DnrJ/EryC1/StrS family aminotransferase [Actinomycetota bacterium]
MKIFDIRRHVAAQRAEIDAAVARVLDSAQFVLGVELQAFEREFAAAFGMTHAVGVASGTDAVHLALRACGIGPGDRVGVPALTFFATAEAVLHAGATPVVIDVDPRTATMSPDALAGADVRAAIPVHLYGHPADMDAIGSACALVIEDACQAHGARYKQRFAGTMGAAAAFSFYPTKNLSGAGDGGMVATRDPAVADRVRLLRHHGQATKDVHEEVGYTSRLDDLQAAILRVRLRHLDATTKARRQVAAWYRDALAGLALELPHEAEWAEHVWHLYVIRADPGARDRIVEGLRARDIAATVHYPVPLSRQPALARLGLTLPPCPVAERIVTSQITLPMDPAMTAADVDAVAAALKELV